MSSRGAADRTDVDDRLQLAVFAGDATQIYALPREGRVGIGRGQGNLIVIDHPSVSRNHAVLHVGAVATIEDLGSRNGTLVRSQRVSSPVAVDVGVLISLGEVRVALRTIRAVERLFGRTAPMGGDGSAGDAVVASDVLRAVYDEAKRVAATAMTVLLLGETGVGKDVLARWIHASSPRRGGPFLALNCATLSEALLESELFGHEKGAFTGAGDAKPGLLEAASGGTVFLDEIGELPPAIQAKLLRVLEDRTVLRIGGRAPRAIDVRFIAATNRDLTMEVARGAFRRDLLFRLNAFALFIPPLRDRASEIPGLSRHFLANAQCAGPRPSSISPEALALLERHTWPGNIRELRNVVERAAIFCDGGVVLPAHLPEYLRSSVAGAEPLRVAVEPAEAQRTTPPTGRVLSETTSPPSLGLKAELDGIERRRIIDALEICDGNQTQAAVLLGLTRRVLISRIAALKLPRPRKPPPSDDGG